MCGNLVCAGTVCVCVCVRGQRLCRDLMCVGTVSICTGSVCAGDNVYVLRDCVHTGTLCFLKWTMRVWVGIMLAGTLCVWDCVC